MMALFRAVTLPHRMQAETAGSRVEAFVAGQGVPFKVGLLELPDLLESACWMRCA